MSKLTHTNFTGTLTMDTDGAMVDVWLEDNEERMFRRHFDREFADLVYMEAPSAEVGPFVAGFFPLFRRVLFAEYQKQKNALTAGSLASEVSPSLGGVGVNFKALILEIGNEGAIDCNEFVLGFDFGDLTVKFVPFQTSNIYGL